jgi:hypothetical protein
MAASSVGKLPNPLLMIPENPTEAEFATWVEQCAPWENYLAWVATHKRHSWHKVGFDLYLRYVGDRHHIYYTVKPKLGNIVR